MTDIYTDNDITCTLNTLVLDQARYRANSDQSMVTVVSYGYDINDIDVDDNTPKPYVIVSKTLAITDGTRDWLESTNVVLPYETLLTEYVRVALRNVYMSDAEYQSVIGE